MRNTAKALHFPSLGVAAHLSYAEATIPDENHAYATPSARNVWGKCTFGDRARGGSRPGLKRLVGASSESGGIWRWPNGSALQWPDGGNILYSLPFAKYSGPDGAPFVNPHQPYTPTAAKGTAPSGVRAMAWYRYRLFVAKDAQWYASRSGDIADWDYGGDMEDISRAATGTVSKAGIEGETITAMMPILDRCIYIATDRALWCLAGEPTNGTLACVAEGVGCVGPDAWCYDGRTLWFFSSSGIFSLVPGETGPEHFSGRLPTLKATDPSAIMAADHAQDGILLFSADGDFFLDPSAKAIWPIAVPSAMRPSAFSHVMADHENVTVMLGSDGKWRYFDAETDADDKTAVSDGTPIESELVIGPFRVSGSDAIDGILDEVRVTLGEGSGDVTIGVATAKTAEGAAKAVRVAANQYAGGYNFTQRARRRGAWGCIKLTSSARWAYESVLVTLKALGRLR